MVRHSIRGRLRVKVAFLHLHMENSAHLGQLLAEQAGVKSAEVRPITASVILYYDPEKTTPHALVKLLPEVLKASLRAIANSRAKKPPPSLSRILPLRRHHIGRIAPWGRQVKGRGIQLCPCGSAHPTGHRPRNLSSAERTVNIGFVRSNPGKPLFTEPDRNDSELCLEITCLAVAFRLAGARPVAAIRLLLPVHVTCGFPAVPAGVLNDPVFT
jgi:hypothetical protein